jgi:hypothetical protein
MTWGKVGSVEEGGSNVENARWTRSKDGKERIGNRKW